MTAGEDVKINGRALRVGYLSGPSDADRVYDDLLQSRPANYFGTNYMRQFLLLMTSLGARAEIETWFGGRAYRKRTGPFLFNNVPEPRSRGVAYHVGQVIRQLGVLRRMLRFRPDLLVLTGKQGYWWVLAPLRLLGTRFIASFHCVLWPPYGRVKMHERLLLHLDRMLVLRHLKAVVSTSKQITDQFTQMAGSRADRVPVFAHLPTYDPEQFADLPPPEPDKRMFRTMFSGRIEANKGIYLVLKLARQLHEARPGQFVFEICGDGSELESVRAEVEELGLSNAVKLHGYCTPDQMKDVIRRSDAVIVPTRSDFAAGFEMTCAEAILGGRPLVTSKVCPALEYLRPASIEVPPDDADAYQSAIEALRDDPELYETKRAQCREVSDQFFDPSKSWDAAMRQAIDTALALETVRF